MSQQRSEYYSDEFQYSFDFFWKKVIEPTIQNAFEEIDSDFKDACSLQLAYNSFDDYKSKLMEFYREKRQWLKGVYLPHENHPLLDMHKLGAVLCRSILAYKPFYFDFKAAEKFVVKNFSGDKRNHIDWFIRNIYVNYRVAFYVSTGLIYLELLYSHSAKGKTPNEKAFNYYQDLKGVMYYEKSDSHDSYENSCIIALQKNDVLQRSFDYLTYAANLFQLEIYNRMLYRINILETEN